MICRRHCAQPTLFGAGVQHEILTLKSSYSLGHHHLHELLVIDLAIPIHIGFTDHLLHLLVCQLLAEVGHAMSKLGCGDEATAIAVEHLEEGEGLLELGDLLLCELVSHDGWRLLGKGSSESVSK